MKYRRTILVAIAAGSLIPVGTADAAACWARGMNGTYENRPAVYGDCSSGSARMTGFFLTRLGVPYSKSTGIEAGGGVEYLYGRPGERYFGASLS